MKRRAIVSVSDKTGVVDFCKRLIDLNFEIISTGGTKKTLDEAGIKTIAVDEVTNFNEMLDGRVKTLHPLIHGGLLGILDNDKHVMQMKDNNIEPITLVCVNLYPFKETIKSKDKTFMDAIENIDIGGPSMLRSAAKNHRFVSVVCDSNDYDLVIDEFENHGDTTYETRLYLAAKAFKLTATYDTMIQNYLNKFTKLDNKELLLSYRLKQELRYGENPHQSAAFYSDELPYRYSMSNAIKLHGKELSYNNIQDANAALQILKEFSGTPAVVGVKHMNPCGVGLGNDISEAWNKAYKADPISIFGGIIAFNEEVNVECAKAMSNIFLEIILAPSFNEEAFNILSQKKNIRLMTFDLEGNDDNRRIVSVTGGVLLQDADEGVESYEDFKVVTNKKPSEEELKDALFGMKIVKHVKSNAIVLVKEGQSIGIGAGQMNRVGSCLIACKQADDKARGSMLASDAFFPMSDTVELAAKYGITCIIQPGGSIKDQDSIDECNKHNIAMIFTGRRHFKH